MDSRSVMSGQGWIWIALALGAALILLGVYWRARRVQAARAQARALAAARAADPTAPARVQVRRLRTHTQHPIVLAHGWGSFDRLLPVQLGYSYFRGIPDGLRARGHVVHVARVPPTASIELRAQQLARQIKRLDERVNIVAHSMGGLDARLAIARYGLHDRVASLTTIGTPHHGTPLADVAFVLGEWRRSRRLLSQLGWNIDGVYDVSTARMLDFNRQVPDAPDVLYTNVVAAADPTAGGVHAMLAAGYRYLLRISGPNDGIVPAQSQRWGETLEEVDADHWAQIGWFARFDVHGFYARIAQRLAEREL
ncbi:MAG: alpha/beta fold hydrolase [Polyangiales bacterium]